MKISFISDSHALHEEIHIEPCDILCHTGDYSHKGELSTTLDFIDWFAKQPAKHKVLIAGNHDKTLDKELIKNSPFQQSVSHQIRNEILINNIHLLENSSINIEGLNIYGTPVSPTFGVGWAFNKNRGDEINKYWMNIPKNTDILLTHTPPYGILDVIPEHFKRYIDEDVHRGCEDLLNRLPSLTQLKIHAFGHIHENNGYILKPVSIQRFVYFVNSACVTNRNELLVKIPITIIL